MDNQVPPPKTWGILIYMDLHYTTKDAVQAFGGAILFNSALLFIFLVINGAVHNVVFAAFSVLYAILILGVLMFMIWLLASDEEHF